MKSTEVTLGADSAQSATNVDMTPKGFSISSHPKFMGVAVGALVGWAYSHAMKHDRNKKIGFIGGGAALGWAIGAYIEHRRAIVITKSK